ncbi:hypothetical protein COPG_00130 [Colwellia phage 9A]|uniref:Uncharacterized protein n=1 Tax=Colwellia phage 9A TaxID=765765 RepID=I3UML1_9CAUD|nr:hypothetical protein COPG_00130 [Colwellia phage 9A]AFK66726.1 hypothetical protein COPG_00130 [Colwellia phage 9A]
MSDLMSLPNTPRKQKSSNKLILALLKKNNVVTPAIEKENGILLGRLLLVSVKEALRFIEAYKEHN